MLDARYFRNHLADLQTAMQARNFPVGCSGYYRPGRKRKAVQVRSEQLQKSATTPPKNRPSQSCGAGYSALVRRRGILKGELAQAEAELAEVQAQMDALVLSVPNIPAEGVPAGKSEDDNVEVRTWGTRQLLISPSKTMWM